MIKVLHKAFNVLELLASQPETPMRLQHIAEKLYLNPATCANILQTMVDRGMVEQVSRKDGYILGPMAYHLASLGQYRRDIVQVAQTIVMKLAIELHETVVLATLKNGRRYILCHTDGNPALQIRRDGPHMGDTYITPTGRLLLAHLREYELERFVLEHGLPGDQWPEANGTQKLRSVLNDIRGEGRLIMANEHGLTLIALPVQEHNQVVAALGLTMLTERFKGKHKAGVLADMKAAAMEIGDKLTARPLGGERSQ